MLFGERWEPRLGAAQSVNALDFQHEGARCHVREGQSGPNSVTEIPLNSSRLLELKFVTATDTQAVMFNTANSWTVTLGKEARATVKLQES